MIKQDDRDNKDGDEGWLNQLIEVVFVSLISLIYEGKDWTFFLCSRIFGLTNTLQSLVILFFD